MQLLQKWPKKLGPFRKYENNKEHMLKGDKKSSEEQLIMFPMKNMKIYQFIRWVLILNIVLQIY